MSSSARFTTWGEALLAKNRTKANSAVVAKALEAKDEALMESLLKQPEVVFLAKSTARQGSLTVLHHFTRLENNDKTTTYVALAGLSSRAYSVELDEKQHFNCVKVKAPAWKQLVLFGTDDKESEPQNYSHAYTLCPVQAVPSNLQQALLHASDHSPAALLATATQTLREGSTDRDNEVDDHCKSYVAYLWSLAKNKESKLAKAEVEPSSSSGLLEWNNKMHKEHIASDDKPTELAPRSSGDGRKQRTWDESFARLVAYRQFYGDCNCPREFKSDPALGEWVKHQRATKKTLSEERRAKLESIGFVFSNTQQDRSNKIWESFFERLQAYVELHGDCRPSKRETKEERSLQHWVCVQRQTYKRGAMPEDRIKRLEAIGFTWKLKNDYKKRTPKEDIVWRQGYQKLVEFHKVHSHVNVPKRPKGNRPLWEWVYSQKKAYNEQRLSQVKVETLEKLGMQWERDNGQAMRDKQWDTKYKEAKAFRELHGHLEVPRSGTYGNTNLLKWAGRQREQFKNDKLAANRVKLLLELDFDFYGNPAQRNKLLEKLAWKEVYSELLAYHEANGTVSVPEKGNAQEKRLEKWVAKQKVAYQFNDLDPSRKELLMELGVEFVDIMMTADEGPGERRKPSKMRNKKAGTSEEATTISAQGDQEGGLKRRLQDSTADAEHKRKKVDHSMPPDAVSVTV